MEQPQDSPNTNLMPDNNEAPVDSPSPQMTSPKKQPKGLLYLLVVLVVSALGFASWMLLSAPKNTKKSAVDKPKTLEVFRFGYPSGEFTGFYPANTNTPLDNNINRQVFEGLVGYSKLTRIEPRLAVSWTNPNDVTWVFKLKPNVKFHSGNTMSAKDVKAGIEASLKNDELKSFTSTIKSIEVVNDLTVKITTTEPDPILLNKLTFLYVIDSASSKPNDSANGTGPYVIKSGTEATKTNVILTAFSGYHGGEVLTKEVEVKAYDGEEALITDLKAKKINMGVDISDKSLADLVKLGFTSEKTESPYVSVLIPNAREVTSPASKLKVRQAIYLATDPQALLKANDLSGIAASQLVPSTIPGFNNEIVRPERNTTKAKTLLSEAGYPNGVTLKLPYYSPFQDKRAEEIKKQLAEAGITVALTAHKDLNAYRTATKGKLFDLTITSYASDILDGIDVVNNFFIDAPEYKNEEVNKLASKASTTIDASNRLTQLKQLSKIIMDDVGWIPLFIPYTNTALDSNDYVLVRDTPGTDLGFSFAGLHKK